MAKAVPAILFLAFACLFALCTALPAVLSQTVSAQTKPNVPNTLLGKPYRRRRKPAQPCPPSRWTAVLADHNDPDPDASSSTDVDGASRNRARARIGNSGWMQTRMDMNPRVSLLFPESRWVRLRPTRSKRRMVYSCCSDDVPWFAQGGSEGMTLRDE